MPVEEGGLGFRRFEVMVDAFSAKLWWKLQLKNSIWVKFMHSKYIKGQHPSIAQVTRSSPVWRQLEHIRDFAESKIRWCLGKGLVDFWYDRWVLDD